jgi:hypothetical protein
VVELNKTERLERNGAALVKIADPRFCRFVSSLAKYPSVSPPVLSPPGPISDGSDRSKVALARRGFRRNQLPGL